MIVVSAFHRLNYPDPDPDPVDFSTDLSKAVVLLVVVRCLQLSHVRDYGTFRLRKLIIYTRMRSHPVGLDV